MLPSLVLKGKKGMAYSKKTNTASKTAEKIVEEKAVETVTEKTNVQTVTQSVEKTFEPEDLIPCRSMVSGQLFIEGTRSKLLYTFADYGDVCDIEYRDLIYLVRSYRDKTIYEPRIVVEDEDFIAQNPKLSELYETMYTNGDLIDVINLPLNQMVNTVNSLPAGCKNALKGVVATMIDSGALDSIKKIKALDDIFGTNMMITLVQE